MTVAKPELNNIAAAAANTALDTLLNCLIDSTIVFHAAILPLPYKDPANAEIITDLSKIMPDGAPREGGGRVLTAPFFGLAELICI